MDDDGDFGIPLYWILLDHSKSMLSREHRKHQVELGCWTNQTKWLAISSLLRWPHQFTLVTTTLLETKTANLPLKIGRIPKKRKWIIFQQIKKKQHRPSFFHRRLKRWFEIVWVLRVHNLTMTKSWFPRFRRHGLIAIASPCRRRPGTGLMKPWGFRRSLFFLHGKVCLEVQEFPWCFWGWSRSFTTADF